jgi:hypothetical protein
MIIISTKTFLKVPFQISKGIRFPGFPGEIPQERDSCAYALWRKAFGTL